MWYFYNEKQAFSNKIYFIRNKKCHFEWNSSRPDFGLLRKGSLELIKKSTAHKHSDDRSLDSNEWKHFATLFRMHEFLSKFYILFFFFFFFEKAAFFICFKTTWEILFLQLDGSPTQHQRSCKWAWCQHGGMAGENLIHCKETTWQR